MVAALAATAGAHAQESPPRIVFDPALNIAQAFHVSYRLSQTTPGSAAGSRLLLGVGYRLEALATAREGDGYRLRLSTSEITRLGPPEGMDMVVAAALMLDGMAVDVRVDARGFLKEVIDWPSLQGTLQQRANSLGGVFGGIGRSVVDDRTAQQVGWVLFPAFDAMNRARSYYDVAKVTGASTVSWFGSPIDMTIGSEDGAVRMSWVSPAASGNAWVSKASVQFRRDGLVSHMTMTVRDPGISRQSTTIIDEAAPP